MYIQVNENPNCSDNERVFSEQNQPKKVIAVQLESPHGTSGWWTVASVDENGHFGPAEAVLVEDSGAGTAWLIYGGSWGLRFKPLDSQTAWDLKNDQQWGTAFKVLDSSGTDIRFDP